MGKELKCVRGYFKKLHARGPEYPFVKAVLLRSIGGSVSEVGIVEFLIDTGGGLTVLSRIDAVRLGIADDVDVRKCVDAVGIGTERECALKYEVSIALIDAHEEGKRLEVPVDEPGILVAPIPRARHRGAERQIYQRPSILGWNVLKYLRLTVDYRAKTVEICREDV